jgi:hypothetical protein
MAKKVLIVLLFLAVSVSAQYERPGSTDAQFLKIGVSPRGTAMGDAYISMVEGAEGTYYNAASIAWVKNFDVVFNHNFWFADINHDFAAAVYTPDEDLGSFGLSATALYTDEMKVRTPLQPNGTGETFYSGNYRFGLSFARFFTDRVTIGATISLIHMQLYDEFSADAVSVDISTMYVSDFRDFTFAMQISNFGSSIKFVNESYPLPTNFIFGASINALEMETNTLSVAFSAMKPNDGKPLSQVGAEWNYNDIFFARGGYHIDHEIAKYTFGAGFKLDFLGYGLRADYSYNDFSLLGAAHRFGLGISFD